MQTCLLPLKDSGCFGVIQAVKGNDARENQIIQHSDTMGVFSARVSAVLGGLLCKAIWGEVTCFLILRE